MRNRILVTGSKGFIGKNLISRLVQQKEIEVLEFDKGNTLEDLREQIEFADMIYHLAGVNRPQSLEEFRAGNVDMTAQMCKLLLEARKRTPIVLASSIQADLDNPYGLSKKQAEQVLADYSACSGASVVIFRLSNVFGKWCRPNYNSVAATFCHNIARGLPITISDPGREVPLVYVDDVINAFLGTISELQGANLPVEDTGSVSYREISPIYTVTLGRLAELIRSFRESRQSLLLPDLSNPFTYKLYGTFLSYLDPDGLAYDLTKHSDHRGSLAEFIKSPAFGQIFVSRTKPGITRGNHYHHTKAEKFLVLEGEALIRFRSVQVTNYDLQASDSEYKYPHTESQAAASMSKANEEVIEYRVSGKDFRVLDIPPGYTHSIENVGKSDMVVLFWASEILDPAHPDTWPMQIKVQIQSES